MRPVRVAVTGLRSHSSTTEVAFPDDWQLASVVGPTGAGKSSLLEAIVYALFGSGTVPSASQPTNLIADNVREMRVVFEFDVGDGRHQIVRTYRRSGASPPPVLNSPGLTVSGAKPVEEAVTRLLGLSQEAFCQTALLPQGRFARLLEANANDQRRTLDEFFRLAEVTEVADRIAGASDRLAAARDRVAAVRQQLPAEPAAAVAAAEAEVERAKLAAAAAAALVAEVTERMAAAADADAAARAHDGQAKELAAAIGALHGVVEQTAQLAIVAAELDAAETAAGQDESDGRVALETARRGLDQLDGRTIASARAAVDSLAVRLVESERAAGEARHTEESALAAEAEERGVGGRLSAARDEQRVAESALSVVRAMAALAEAKASSDQSEANLAEAAAALEAATREADVANEQAVAVAAEVAAADDAVARAEAVAALAAGVTKAREVASAVQDAVSLAAGTVARAGAAEDETRERHRAASEGQATAERAVAEARRAAAAAAAAMGCRPGEPCPVCERELPDGFAPPQPPPALTGAEKNERAARERLDAAHSDLARASERAAQAGSALTSAEQQAALAELARAEAEGAFTAAAGGDGDPTAALEAAAVARAGAAAAHRRAAAMAATVEGKSQSLGPLTEAVTRWQRAAETTRAAVSKAEQRLAEATAARRATGADAADTADLSAERLAAVEAEATAAAGRLAGLSQRHADLRIVAGNARTEASAAGRRFGEAQRTLTDAVAAIPDAARPPAGRDDDPVAIRDAAEAWTAKAEAELAAAESARQRAQAQIDAAGEALAAIRQRRAAQHDTQLAELISAAAGHAAKAGINGPPAAAAGPGALGSWGAEAIAAVETRRDEEQSQAAAAREVAVAERAAADRRCADAGVALADIGELRRRADETVGQARNALEQATQLAARCAELDAVLTASESRARLLEHGKALGRGRNNFVLHVLAARRRQLLVESSAILAELSGQRLRFDVDTADRFSVVDAGTGTARDPRLLSGGEQFQASLALALGLVEIAARGGSRIECLFLDEGFGALDSRSLDIALDALETAGRRGRRILAVTHVDGVTARCDHVLEVRPGLGGSRAAWREEALV